MIDSSDLDDPAKCIEQRAENTPAIIAAIVIIIAFAAIAYFLIRSNRTRAFRKWIVSRSLKKNNLKQKVGT